jgi:hypothetical protein
MTPTSTDDYLIVKSSGDARGVERIEVLFAAGVDASSLMWKLADDIFGHRKWRIEQEGVERNVDHWPFGSPESGLGLPPQTTPWRKRFVAGRV